jgi:hypothetical protein
MPDSTPPRRKEACVLLFSGGRDSTIAAVRLSQVFERLVLVTVTTGHLIALHNVRRRLAELKIHLPQHSEWIHAVASSESTMRQYISKIDAPRPVSQGTKEVESCLPCHLAYFRIALSIAVKVDAHFVAAGYTVYQSEWLEQTPYAIAQLKSILKRIGKELLLPSHDLKSKEEAQAFLREHNLTESALEQKCLKQQFNDTAVAPEVASAEIEAWGATLEHSLTSQSLNGLVIHAPMKISEVHADDIG